MQNLQDIRNLFGELLKSNTIITDGAQSTIELLGESFAVEHQAPRFKQVPDSLFGTVSIDYVNKELDWYKSESRNVYDMPNPPAIWKKISDKDGNINSNYGWCIYSKENGEQFKNVVRELRKNKSSRRASMIYTRPTMHSDYNTNGMSDFVCTNGVQFSIRNDVLSCQVQMRSNDAIFGFKNDLFWHNYVLTELHKELKTDYPELVIGRTYWNASSLHVYESHFYLVYHYMKTGDKTITKKDFKNLYSDYIETGLTKDGKETCYFKDEDNISFRI